MPDGYLPHSFPAAISWFIDALSIRGDDVFAVIGLIAVVVVLLLWVMIENVRQTRWRSGRTTDGAETTDITENTDATRHVRAKDSSGPALAAEADMAPVRARAEWLLDDNTLVRTGAVTREAVRRKTTAAPQLVPSRSRSRSRGHTQLNASDESETPATHRDDGVAGHPRQL